jgi:hypothetical protein
MATKIKITITLSKIDSDGKIISKVMDDLKSTMITYKFGVNQGLDGGVNINLYDTDDIYRKLIGYLQIREENQ